MAFEDYIKAWKVHDFREVFEKSAPEVKESLRNNPRNFQEYAKDQGFVFSDHGKLDIKINGAVAYVTTDLEYSDFSGNKLDNEREKCELILIDSAWLVRDCKPERQ